MAHTSVMLSSPMMISGASRKASNIPSSPLNDKNISNNNTTSRHQSMQYAVALVVSSVSSSFSSVLVGYGFQKPSFFKPAEDDIIRLFAWIDRDSTTTRYHHPNRYTILIGNYKSFKTFSNHSPIGMISVFQIISYLYFDSQSCLLIVIGVDIGSGSFSIDATITL